MTIAISQNTIVQELIDFTAFVKSVEAEGFNTLDTLSILNEIVAGNAVNLICEDGLTVNCFAL